MIHLHCTKKLLAKLPLYDDGRLRSQQNRPLVAIDNKANPLSGWHANLIILQRRQCVLFVHDATRFPVFVPALKKADFAELDWHFQDGFMNTLLKVGADDTIMKAAEKHLAPLMCDTTTNRSVQGSINRMAQDIGHLLDFEECSVMDLSPYHTGVWLAERPCSIKGKDYIWPAREMLELLGAERTPHA